MSEGQLSESKSKLEPTQRNYTELINNNLAAIRQRLAPQFGVTISVINREGEEYVFERKNRDGKTEAYKGVVPKGFSYISILSSPDEVKFNNFLEVVRAEEKSQQEAANQPKI